MKKYRVEFNTTGFYSGQGIFETLDEIAEVEADNAQEAIALSIDWMSHTEFDMYSADEFDAKDYMYNDNDEIDYDKIKEHIENYAWRAREICKDEDGFEELGEPIVRN